MSAPIRDRNPAPSCAASTVAASASSPARRVLWLVGLSHFTNHFVMLIFPAVLLLVQQEYHLGYFGLGLFANAALLFYGVGALPAGVLADRLGGNRLLAVWLLGGSLACIGIGLSTGPVALVVGLAALGLFGSLHHPAGSGALVVLRNVAGLDVGRAFGFAIETLMGFVFQGFSTFLPAYLSERAQLPFLTAARVARGGSFASLALLFGSLGHLVAGRLMATRHREMIFLAIMGTTAISLFGMGNTTGLPLVLFSIALSIGHFSLGTISNTFIAFHTPPHLGGTAFGITFTLAFGVGSLASGVMGFLGQRFGLPVAFMALGIVAVGATALASWFGHITGALAPGNFKPKTDNVLLIEWVALAYLLSLSSLLLIGGRLGDLFGDKPLYVAGFALFTLVLALSRGAAWGWTSHVVLIAATIAAAGAVLFLRTELRSPLPFFDIRLFRHRLFAAATVSALLNYMATTTTAFLTPFFLIQGNQMTPAHAGSLLMAMPLVMATVAPISGWLSDRIGSRVPTVAGMACLAAGMFLLGRLSVGGSDRQIVLRLGLVGLGIGLFTSPNWR